MVHCKAPRGITVMDLSKSSPPASILVAAARIRVRPPPVAARLVPPPGASQRVKVRWSGG